MITRLWKVCLPENNSFIISLFFFLIRCLMSICFKQTLNIFLMFWHPCRCLWISPSNSQERMALLCCIQKLLGHSAILTPRPSSLWGSELPSPSSTRGESLVFISLECYHEVPALGFIETSKLVHIIRLGWLRSQRINLMFSSTFGWEKASLQCISVHWWFDMCTCPLLCQYTGLVGLESGNVWSIMCLLYVPLHAHLVGL